MFCSECGTKLGDADNFCSNCGALIAKNETAAATNTQGDQSTKGISRRQITVLFCDLVGSTDLTEVMDAEDLFNVLKNYHSMMKKIATRFNGHVAMIVGDGVDLYFGYPVAGEDDVVRAIYSASAIVEEVRGFKQLHELDANLDVRIGIATGLVTVGMLDSMSIAGSTPNLAARIQAVIEPGQIGIAPSTYRIAGEQFTYKDLGMFSLKGIADDIRINVVTGTHGLGSRSSWRGQDNRLPMVGRDRELTELKQAWQSKNVEHAVGVLLLADAGTGKSRLSTAFAGSLAEEAHLAIRLQCSPFHVNSVLHPFLQHIITAAGFSRNDTSLLQAEKLESQMMIAGITDPIDLALVALFLNINIENRYPRLDMPPPAILQMVGGVLFKYFMGLIAQIPAPKNEINEGNQSATGALLLQFDDLHWIDPSSLDLLEKLLSELPLTNCMILMSARPEFEHKFPENSHVSNIVLPKLTTDAAKSMIQNLCESVSLPDSMIDQILSKTDGVPLYIEEMTRMAQDIQSTQVAGIADNVDGVELGVPMTLQDLMMERLDRLGAAKELIQVASVLGQEFSEELLASVADVDEQEFSDELDKVIEAELLLRSGVSNLKFKHALIENIAYESILLKSRVALHRRVADCLQGEFSSLAQGSPQLLAHHLLRANHELEASRFLLQAGVMALQSGAPREAAGHLKAGLASIEKVKDSAEKDEMQLSLLSVLGPTTMVLMGPGSPAFGDVQKRAYALCHKLPGKPREFPITYGLCLYHWGRAEFEIAEPMAKKLLDTANAIEADNSIAPDVSSEEAVMAACNMNGMIAFHMGDSVKAREHLQRSVNIYQPERDAALYPIYLMDFGVFGRFYLALATIACGEADIATQHALDAAKLAEELNQPHSIGFSLLANMTIAAQRDDFERAEKISQQCIEFSSQFGFPEFIGMSRVIRGWAIAQLGHPAIGLDDLETGFSLWNETGFENWQSWFTCLKADVLKLLNKSEQATKEIDTQLERIQNNKELQFKEQLLQRKKSFAAA